MKRIFVPTQSANDWQRLLAKPELHWKKGRSAMASAACWEAANDALPKEVSVLLNSTSEPDLVDLDLLIAVPEWEVALEGGETASQTDVLALARNEHGLVVIGVEAKVDEEFGPTLGRKRLNSSQGQNQRMNYLHTVLRLAEPLADSIRYQLLHRTASVILTAQAFHASAAVMLVQSFSPVSRWREDFDAFCTAVDARAVSGDVSVVPTFEHPSLYLAWCAGEEKFLDVEVPSAL